MTESHVAVSMVQKLEPKLLTEGEFGPSSESDGAILFILLLLLIVDESDLCLAALLGSYT